MLNLISSRRLVMETSNGKLSYQITTIDQLVRGEETATDEAAVALATKTAHIYRKPAAYTDIVRMQDVTYDTHTFDSLDSLLLNISYKDSFYGVVLFMRDESTWVRSYGIYTKNADDGYILIDAAETRHVTLDPDVRKVFEKTDANDYIVLTIKKPTAAAAVVIKDEPKSVTPKKRQREKPAPPPPVVATEPDQPVAATEAEQPVAAAASASEQSGASEPKKRLQLKNPKKKAATVTVPPKKPAAAEDTEATK